MPVGHEPPRASGAFSRKLSEHRDTYQLIFTGTGPGHAPFDIIASPPDRFLPLRGRQEQKTKVPREPRQAAACTVIAAISRVS